MSNDALEIVRLRNNFYRDNYRRVVVGLLALLIVNVLLATTLIYLVTHPPQPVYFATSVDGKITPLYPLNEPVLSDAELLQWVTQAATSVNTFSFVNYRQELQNAANEYFTPEGWQQYEAALQKSRNLETVVDKRLVSTAVATGAPAIIDRAVINGRYAWKIKLPLLITYESATTRIPQPVEVVMVVSRVPTTDRPKGIAIVQYVASEQVLNQ